MIVAVDGPAGVGKSTIAKMIAESCGFYYINSGNFYRAITYNHINLKRDPSDTELLIQTAKQSKIEIINSRIHLNGVDVEDCLHTDSVDAFVAAHSAVKGVRLIVNEALRNVAENLDVIAEGRDITTVVFPHADLKFYFDAALEIRAKRRYKQQDTSLTFDELVKSIEIRDGIDKNKEFGALQVANEAIYIDTSYLTIDQVCEKVVQKILYTKQN